MDLKESCNCLEMIHKKEVQDERRAELEGRWRAICSPLPGSEPYLSRRPCRIKAKEGGQTFIDVLANRFPGRLSHEEWLQVFAEGQVTSNSGEELIRDPFLRVETGQQYVRLLPNWVEPEVGTDLKVIYEDEALFIIDKPAPLPMHEGGRFCKNTLIWLMKKAWPELDLRYAHRLDAETSGVLVCVKGKKYSHLVQKSFEQGRVSKSYLARVRGWPQWEEKVVENPVPADGREWGKLLEARTEFRVLEKQEEGTAIVEARPVTGRTHQIRVHLWHELLPIVGDRLYLPNGERGEVKVAGLGAEPLALRSWKVTLPHPLTGDDVSFEGEAAI